MADYKVTAYMSAAKMSFSEVLSDLHDYIETLDDTTGAVLCSGLVHVSGFGLEAVFQSWAIHKGIDISASASISPSVSASASISPSSSGSASISPSVSESASISPSSSESASISPSVSESASISPSGSESASISPSSSVSPSTGG